ncbi:MAG: DUF6544 family protein [Bacteroidota bacterium]
MLQYIFIVVVGLHALIHLMGFAKAFRIAEINDLKLPISKPIGLLWLLTTVSFFITLLFYWNEYQIWWISGVISVILSQFLVIVFWSDAKFGTIINTVVLIVCLVGFGEWRFDQNVQEEVAALNIRKEFEPDIVEVNEISNLPDIVQLWLQQSNVIGNIEIKSVNLYQSGRMRLEPDSEWLSFAAEQWFLADKPEFIWNVDVGEGSLLQFSGRDKFVDGKGEMLIKILSLISVADASGDMIDQGAAMRYLAEIIWFPSVALNDYIKWEEAGDLRSKATLTFNGGTVSGIFSFNEAGDVVGFEAMRYNDQTGKPEKWIVNIDEESCRLFQGIKIPTEGSITWALEEGDFNWLEVKIDSITYN